MNARGAAALVLAILAGAAACLPPDPEPPAPVELRFWRDPATGCHYWRQTGWPRLTVRGIYCTDDDGEPIEPGDIQRIPHWWFWGWTPPLIAEWPAPREDAGFAKWSSSLNC